MFNDIEIQTSKQRRTNRYTTQIGPNSGTEKCVYTIHPSEMISTQVHHSEETHDTQEQGNNTTFQPERGINHACTSGKTY